MLPSSVKQISPAHLTAAASAAASTCKDNGRDECHEKTMNEAEGRQGRRAEFHALHKAYVSAETSDLHCKPQIAVVTGQSGIGKSFFVDRSLNIICSHDGYDSADSVRNFVVSGKCNEMNQNQPYSCIIDALSMLCRQLCQLDLLLESIRQEILSALNKEGRVLLNFVPAMRDVIGVDHEEVLELKGRERQIRLERVVRRFIGVVASYCPLVVKLDDLQWADGATLDFIRSLATSTKLRGLLLVCIYRENDADAKRNMLDKYFLQLKGDKACITQIRIQPLASMRGLIESSGLEIDAEGAEILAKFLQKHSNGNTFFAVRLLDYILFRHYVQHPSSHLISELEKISIPPTLEDLLAIEIDALPPLTKDALIWASCIGYYFDDFIFEKAIQLSCIDDQVSSLSPFVRQRCMSEAITLAMDMGLVEKVGSNLGYRFIHDSLWKAFYTMLPQASRNKLHLEIGRAMKVRFRPSEGDIITRPSRTRIKKVAEIDMDTFIDHYLCSTVDQLNRGKDLMTENGEIVELLLMNIKAAELSALDCSWKSALQYIEKIQPMLEEDEHWAQRYDMCLLVNTMHAEINLSLCNFEATRSTVEIILRNGKSIDDTYDAYLLWMRSLNSQKKTADAYSIATDVLDKLGVEARWLHKGESAEKDKFRAKIKKMVKKQSFKRIAALPPLSDERKLKAVKIFYWLLVASFGSDLHELCSGKIFQLTVEYGFCEEGVNGILTYASGYLSSLPMKKNEISRAATYLHDQLNSKKFTHDYCLILGGYLQCWSDPLQATLTTLLEGLTIGNKTGHIDNAAICGSLLCSYSLFSGEKLRAVERKMLSFAEWAKESRLYGSSRLGFLPFLQLVKCLQNGSGGHKHSLLIGTEMDSDEMNAASQKSTMVACSLALCKLELACIFGDHALAGEILTESPEILKVRPGHFSGCRFTFYEFLTSAELARSTIGTKSSTWSKRADTARKQIKDWIKNGNVNCDHLYPLIKAEHALMKGKKSSARKYFEYVIEAAKSGAFLQDRAICMERAARFFQGEGDIILALSCYNKSIDLFGAWGAAAKQRALSQKILELSSSIH